MSHRVLRVAALLLAIAGCGDGAADEAATITDRFRGEKPPDVMPAMLTQDPFRYPAALYEQRVQGNVTLRIFIDSLGQVRPESTVVVQSSGYTSLDSAAVRASQDLRFRPAQRDGAPVAISTLLPVYYRHPEAPPMPGDDSLLPPPRGTTAPPAAPARP